VIGLLDIGSAKTCCLIAEIMPPTSADDGRPAVRLLGLGHKESRGVRFGTITDLGAAAETVRSTVGEAEHQAGLTLESVTVGVACGGLQSRHLTARTEVAGPVVVPADLDKMRYGAEQFLERDGRSIVALVERGYQLDEAAGIRDPRGMTGRHLAVGLHAVTAGTTALANLSMTIQNSHLTADAMVVSASASALATTSEHERQIGVICIDIGAGVTQIAAYEGGDFVWTDVVLAGGQQITYDISNTIATPLSDAERIKVRCGTMARVGSDDHHLISLPSSHEEGQLPARITRAQLRNVIQPRVEWILAQIADRLRLATEQGLISQDSGSRVILTGGTSQLIGLAELASGMLGRRVEYRPPAVLEGLPADLFVASFATLNGLLYAALQPQAGRIGTAGLRAVASGFAGSVRRWLQDSF
jgi:cell division protein FtsA